ncbi:MAG: hypothetical protein GX754_05725 [Clostridiaceae bacterium]|nr:hypothetical protein [Clostridiaceae bacterium]
MPSRAVVFGICIVILTALLVSMVEFFLPVSAKFEMNALCRKTLLKMELEGGITTGMRDELEEALLARGFRNIVIDGTVNAKYGDEISLWVESYYVYDKINNLFSRGETGQRMVYSKKSIARKVIN